MSEGVIKLLPIARAAAYDRPDETWHGATARHLSGPPAVAYGRRGGRHRLRRRGRSRRLGRERAAANPWQDSVPRISRSWGLPFVLGNSPLEGKRHSRFEPATLQILILRVGRVAWHVAGNLQGSGLHQCLRSNKDPPDARPRAETPRTRSGILRGQPEAARREIALPDCADSRGASHSPAAGPRARDAMKTSAVFIAEVALSCCATRAVKQTLAHKP